jgi:hypothetical protein
MHRPLLLLGLLCTLLAGCAADIRNEALTNTLTRYGSVVRWGDMKSAVAFIDPKVLAERPVSTLEMSRYDLFRITSYDEGAGPQPGEQPDEVRQVVQIGLVNNNTQSERHIVDKQVWRYDQATHHWWLMTGLPDISR